jgi:hypothetical protein
MGRIGQDWARTQSANDVFEKRYTNIHRIIGLFERDVNGRLQILTESSSIILFPAEMCAEISAMKMAAHLGDRTTS